MGSQIQRWENNHELETKQKLQLQTLIKDSNPRLCFCQTCAQSLWYQLAHSEVTEKLPQLGARNYSSDHSQNTLICSPCALCCSCFLPGFSLLLHKLKVQPDKAWEANQRLRCWAKAFQQEESSKR